MPGHPRRRRVRDSRDSATRRRPSRSRSRSIWPAARSVNINGASGLLIGRFDRVGQRRDLATQWRRVRDRRNRFLERGARRRPIDTVTAAVAPPSPAPSDDGSAVRTLELTKHYGPSVALSGLTMVVPRGEVFGFLGPNGSGKTTAVKLLLGLSRPTGGEAWVLGRPAGHRETRRNVGYLPELFRYQGWLSAAEVLGAPLPACGHRSSPSGRRRSPERSRRSGSPGMRTPRSRRSPKGMQQRLGLGVALLGRPGTGDPRRAHVGARPGRPGGYRGRSSATSGIVAAPCFSIRTSSARSSRSATGRQWSPTVASWRSEGSTSCSAAAASACD